MRRRRKRAKVGFFTKKRLTIFGISLAVILIGFVIVLGFGGMFTGYENDSEIVEPVDKETGKINVLLAGTDYYGGCTDTIMVASYDLDDNKIDILSIPRDTRMYIGNKYHKINAAYSITKNGKRKGIQGTIEAVTRLTGIPINYYVEFTFETFRNAIDALGGVEFYVPQNMNYDDPVQNLHIHLKEGQQLLDGDKAEQLVRFRRYPMGDIDRVKVQQDFIKAVAQQKLNLGIITNLPDLFDVVKKDLKTNFKASDIAKYALNLQDLTSENVRTHALPGYANSTDYGASYWIVDMDALATLIETEFGYDADNITVHSKDGKSAAGDVKVTPTPSSESEGATTPEPTKDAEKDEPKKTDKPKKTQQPKKTPEVETTPEPEKETVETTPEPTPTPTAKPTATPKPTQSLKPTTLPSIPVQTEKPVKTPEATSAPQKTPETDDGVKRPSANT